MEGIEDDGDTELRLPAELIRRIASQLSPYCITFGLRLACKELSVIFSGQEHKVVHLSRPVPPDIFAGRWGTQEATRPLTLDQWHKLLRSTAASGVIANLQLLLSISGLHLKQEALHAAAKGGELPMCRWLHQHHGLAWDDKTLAAAAEGGHLELCKALKAEGCPLSAAALSAAAGSGNAQLVEWLLGAGCAWCAQAAGVAAHRGQSGIMTTLVALSQGSPYNRSMHYDGLLEGAAWGCGLADLCRVHEQWQANSPPLWDGRRGPTPRDGTGGPTPRTGGGQPRIGPHFPSCLCSAVLSPTPDWIDKAAWLLDEQGYPACVSRMAQDDAQRAMGRPDAALRVEWMLQRGLLTAGVMRTLLEGAVRGGCSEAVAALLDAGANLSLEEVREAACAAASQGHVGLLQLLHTRGFLVPAEQRAYSSSSGRCPLFTAAVRGGHVAVLDWLERTVYPDGLPPPSQPPLDRELMAAAVRSHSVPVLRWLQRRGLSAGDCELDIEDALGVASVEAVDWLMEHGQLAKHWGGGDPYIDVGRCGNMPVLAELHRLGCPWAPGPLGSVLTRAVQARVPCHVLRWMAAQGAPVDPPALRRAALSWLRAPRVELNALLDELAIR